MRALLFESFFQRAVRALAGLSRRGRWRVRAPEPVLRHPAHVPPGPAVPPPNHPQMTVVMLGPFRLFQNGVELTNWHGNQGLRVLKYLLAHRRGLVPKERLMDLIWPQAPPEAGRRNLHQAIYSLRRSLHIRQPALHHVLLDGDCYRLNPGLDIRCDVDAFEARADDGHACERTAQSKEAIRAYRAAESLYGGEYLEDSPYEEWTLSERDRLGARYVQVMQAMTALHLERLEADDAVACARRLLVRAPADELAHHQIIRGHLAAGRRADALAQYRHCANALEREYGLTPSDEITALCDELLAPPATRLTGQRNGHLTAK